METFSRRVTNNLHFYPCLFDYEPWNHCPQVIEGGTCDDHLITLVSHMDHETIIIAKLDDEAHSNNVKSLRLGNTSLTLHSNIIVASVLSLF